MTTETESENRKKKIEIEPIPSPTKKEIELWNWQIEFLEEYRTKLIYDSRIPYTRIFPNND